MSQCSDEDLEQEEREMRVAICCQVLPDAGCCTNGFLKVVVRIQRRRSIISRRSDLKEYFALHPSAL